jgi:hypothetical protein
MAAVVAHSRTQQRFTAPSIMDGPAPADFSAGPLQLRHIIVALAARRSEPESFIQNRQRPIITTLSPEGFGEMAPIGPSTAGPYEALNASVHVRQSRPLRRRHGRTLLEGEAGRPPLERGRTQELARGNRLDDVPSLAGPQMQIVAKAGKALENASVGFFGYDEWPVRVFAVR